MRVVGVAAQIRFDPSVPDGMPRKLMDSRRLLELGWKPETSLEDGLQKFYAWCLEAQVFDGLVVRAAPIDPACATLERSAIS